LDVSSPAGGKGSVRWYVTFSGGAEEPRCERVRISHWHFTVNASRRAWRGVEGPGRPLSLGEGNYTLRRKVKFFLQYAVPFYGSSFPSGESCLRSAYRRRRFPPIVNVTREALRVTSKSHSGLERTSRKNRLARDVAILTSRDEKTATTNPANRIARR